MGLFHSHSQSHDHGAATGHGHHQGPASYNRIFALGVGLNIVFVVVELSYGLLADSLALLADAGHNLSDVLALLLAWGATYLARRKPSETRTYGLKRATILASLISTAMLLVALGAIGVEAFERLMQPAPVDSATVVVVAGIGVVVNTATALLFLADRKRDLNMAAAFQHMAADAAISLGVVIAALAIAATGWLWLDPAVSLLIALIIFASSWSLLRDSLDLSMDAVPPSVDLPGVRQRLLATDWVLDIHDLHIWALSTTETALTVHLVTDCERIDNQRLLGLQQMLHDDFAIEHSTIQVEYFDAQSVCLLNRPRCQ